MAALPPVVPAEAVVLGLLICSDQWYCPSAPMNDHGALWTYCGQLHAAGSPDAGPAALVAPEVLVAVAASPVQTMTAASPRECSTMNCPATAAVKAEMAPPAAVALEVMPT